QRARPHDRPPGVLSCLGDVLLLGDQGQAGRHDRREAEQDPAHPGPEPERHRARGDRGRGAGQEADDQLTGGGFFDLVQRERWPLLDPVAHRRLVGLPGHATSSGTAAIAAARIHTPNAESDAGAGRARRSRGMTAAAYTAIPTPPAIIPTALWCASCAPLSSSVTVNPARATAGAALNRPAN